MVKKSELSRDISSLSDLTQDERIDLELLFEDGLLPTEAARRMQVPVLVTRNAHRSWQRNKEIQASKAATPENVAQATSASSALQDVRMMLKEQIEKELLQAQLDDLRENARHRREMHKLDEEEKRLTLRERRRELQEDYGEGDEQEEAPTLDDFERDPVGTGMKFIKELRNMPPKNTQNIKPSPDAIRSPQSDSMPEPSKELSEAEIDAYIDSQPAMVRNAAVKMAGSKDEPELRRIIQDKQPGISNDDLDKIIERLKARKVQK